MDHQVLTSYFINTPFLIGIHLAITTLHHATNFKEQVEIIFVKCQQSHCLLIKYALWKHFELVSMYRTHHIWASLWILNVLFHHITPWPFRYLFVACVCPSVCPWTLTCLHNNSSQIWAEITKFSINMHPGILPAGIKNRGLWPWPSRSFWPFWLKILGNLSCPHNNLNWIWARIIEFASNMDLEIFLSGIEYEGHWPWH